MLDLFKAIDGTRCLIVMLCPKMLTCVYTHKKIGDEGGRRGGEKLSGERGSHTGWWAGTNLDETPTAISCSTWKWNMQLSRAMFDFRQLLEPVVIQWRLFESPSSSRDKNTKITKYICVYSQIWVFFKTVALLLLHGIFYAEISLNLKPDMFFQYDLIMDFLLHQWNTRYLVISMSKSTAVAASSIELMQSKWSRFHSVSGLMWVLRHRQVTQTCNRLLNNVKLPNLLLL